MSGPLARLRGAADRAAEAVSVALLAAMFAAFVLQIVSRYLFDAPLGWTLELCLTTWLWLVFWTSAFVLGERDHVRFDVLYLSGGRRLRRAFALAAALAILAGFLASLPATLDYITFYRIKHSATLHIRLDWVFSVYGLFAVAMVVRYLVRSWRLVRGETTDEDAEAGA
ncbi:TRAP-type C4-dicarboxylate transport system, small permease component [Tistlia consotensis]|uniref:TRAP transporter small permease protein n=1 Tax=Tistlia consotensis USBA 355 TaxID=560819 RepID=A0A1Y6C4T7_9PROT|nr:TRAP transporter small permease subunit [Tistlia consotensis]SMF45526.1 TRAP-type C4-dicarboxylate transport system, small permease component [Tistlia consotensis USBA 355]SNR79744.1 TRAP-type C4-dicarboxylate transport system, small permease component [Tistlia consotensis]